MGAFFFAFRFVLKISPTISEFNVILKYNEKY